MIAASLQVEEPFASLDETGPTWVSPIPGQTATRSGSPREFCLADRIDTASSAGKTLREATGLARRCFEGNLSADNTPKWRLKELRSRILGPACRESSNLFAGTTTQHQTPIDEDACPAEPLHAYPAMSRPLPSARKCTHARRGGEQQDDCRFGRQDYWTGVDPHDSRSTS